MNAPAPFTSLRPAGHGPVRWCELATPLGTLQLAADETALVGAWFDAQRHHPGLDALGTRVSAGSADALLQEACTQLGDWFAGRRRVFDLPLAPRGTPFQRAVWAGLCAIAPGHTTGYGALAAQLGRPQASRAVGAATGRNPISLIIPCHRLVGASGALTGYAGGLARKRALLAFEAGAGAHAWAAYAREVAPGEGLPA